MHSHYKPKYYLILLDKHIEVLLLSNDCVIVPGLGGFMTHHIPAQYYTDTQSFLPPLRQLGFNANIQINDSLLAQSYIETYDISYPEAIRRINNEVEELKQILQNEGVCELNGIGALKLNIEGTIVFEPCDAGILTPELYGLNAVDISPLKIQTEDNANNSSNVSELPNPLLDSSSKIEECNDDTEDDTIKIKISTLKKIGTVAAAIIIFFIFALPLGDTPQVKLSESYMDTGILYNILPEELRASNNSQPKEKITFHKKNDNIAPEAKAIESKEENTISDVEAQEDTPQNTQPKDTQSETFYSIVLASQVTKANAMEFIEKLKNSGYPDASLIERSNGLKVIYGRFKTQNEAYNYLYNIRSKNTSFNDGWIMKF